MFIAGLSLDRTTLLRGGNGDEDFMESGGGNHGDYRGYSLHRYVLCTWVMDRDINCFIMGGRDSNDIERSDGKS